MNYSVSSELYLEVLAHLIESIGTESYFSGSFSFPCGEIECRLTASVLVYRRTERLPEGESEVISDLVPVWWEFHTVGDEGELINDFSFARLRALV